MVGCGDKGVEPEEPTVTITHPTDGAVVYEVVEITADARDNKGITMVEFYINGVIPDSTEAIDMQPPYSYSWNTLSLPDSSTYTIYAKAYDTDDHVVGSKLITAMVNNSLAVPSPIVLHDPSDITASSMTLTWTQSTNEDFQCYKIVRSLNEGVKEFSSQIATIYDDSTTSYEVASLIENETYFFKVYVYDVFDFFAGSNEVEGITVNIPPTAATLNDPGAIREDSMTLSWSQNEDHDFGSYRLFRSLTPGVDTLSTLATEIHSRNLRTYTDALLDLETEYFYRVFIYDTGDLVKGSNEVSATTYEVKLTAPDDKTSFGVWEKLRLDWDDVPGTTVYRVQVAGHSNFSSPEISNEVSASFMELTVGQIGPGTYYWRVQAKVHEWGEWSEWRSFTLTIVPAPELLSPSGENGRNGGVSP
jgi:hypothetical protein